MNYKNKELEQVIDSNNNLTEEEKQAIWQVCKCFSQAMKEAYKELGK